MHKSVCKYCSRITPCETGFGVNGHVLGPNQPKYNPPIAWRPEDDEWWDKGLVVCPYHGTEQKLANGPNSKCEFKKLHAMPMVCIEDEREL